MTQHALTDEALERAAKALAEACNGGAWETHYTGEQKALWRTRVRIACDFKADPALRGGPPQ